MITVNPFQGRLNERKCDAADFDGTNDYMLRGAGLTGAADSKSGILSVWHRIDANVGCRLIANSTSPGSTTGMSFTLIKGASSTYSIQGWNSAGVQILSIVTSAYSASATWLHILASWDLASSSAQIYVNDVSDIAGSPTLTNDTIDYTKGDWSIGANVVGGVKDNGCEAEFYFAPGQYLDFSVEANRRKFISSAGKPVHLGTDGSLPTGTAPIVYLHLDDGETVANFATNRGTGGNFTITGTLATASTSPSD